MGLWDSQTKLPIRLSHILHANDSIQKLTSMKALVIIIAIHLSCTLPVMGQSKTWYKGDVELLNGIKV